MNLLLPIFSPLVRLFRSGLSRFGPGGWTVFLLVSMMVIDCAWQIVFAENPWDRGVPEKLSQNESLTIYDSIVTGVWVASIVNLIIGIGVLSLVKFWGRRKGETAGPDAELVVPLSLGVRRFFWISIILAVVAGAWIRAPRLNHSFWNDEEQAFRKFTWGFHRVIDDENGNPSLQFHPTSWDRAVYYTINGNNHVIHTIAARSSHRIWRSIRNPDRETFREAAIRSEACVSGLLTIVALAFWLRVLGFPLGGVAAAWLLALHPWHLRYSVEARGYSSMLLFIVLALLFFGFALKTNRWRWWLAFGAAQCLYLLCFAGAVYLAVAVNLVAAAMLAKNRDGIGLRRWLVACVIGAMVFIQFMTAALFRLLNWIESPDVQPFSMDASFLRDFWAHLTLGIPWSGGNPSLPEITSLAGLIQSGFAQAAVMNLVLPILTVTGIGLACWKAREFRWFFSAFLLAAGMIWIHNQLSQLVFFNWYALYLMLAWIVALAVLPEVLGKAFRIRQGAVVVSAVTLAAILFGYAWISHDPRSAIRRVPRHPMRNAVELARGEAPALSPENARSLTASVGSGANQIQTYDPWNRWLRTVSDLDELIAAARSTGRPLTVYCCGPSHVRVSWPEIFSKLESPDLFDAEEHEELQGIDGYWSFRLYRLRL